MTKNEHYIEILKDAKELLINKKAFGLCNATEVAWGKYIYGTIEIVSREQNRIKLSEIKKLVNYYEPLNISKTCPFWFKIDIIEPRIKIIDKVIAELQGKRKSLKDRFIHFLKSI